MAINHLLFYPPITFLVILGASILFSYLLSPLSFKGKKQDDESRKAYACGEDLSEHRVQVDYGQFYPFAFFFTILHVLALMVATMPIGTIDSFFIAILYLVGAITGLIVLFRR
jgi:NADH:ubiquinone oxidoreductase subunit 3 (subunit A)